MSPISAAACEVLGCLAPFVQSGPHLPRHLRRHSRLSAPEFLAGLDELAARGLVQREAGAVWMTSQGEAWAARLFGAPDVVEAAMV